MTVHYLDPSAWIKRHFQERGSESVNALFASGIRAACCEAGLLEMIATVARKGHSESLSDQIQNTVIRQIRSDFELFIRVPVDVPRIELAIGLARRHRLRTVDALHLASALSLKSDHTVLLVSSDAELLAAANAEGLATLDPSQ